MSTKVCKTLAARDGVQPNDIGKRGRVEAVAFLGRTPVRIDRPESDLYSVHNVEFAHGERLCGWHKDRGGVLDAFRCV